MENCLYVERLRSNLMGCVPRDTLSFEECDLVWSSILDSKAITQHDDDMDCCSRWCHNNNGYRSVISNCHNVWSTPSSLGWVRCRFRIRQYSVRNNICYYMTVLVFLMVAALYLRMVANVAESSDSATGVYVYDYQCFVAGDFGAC